MLGRMGAVLTASRYAMCARTVNITARFGRPGERRAGECFTLIPWIFLRGNGGDLVLGAARLAPFGALRCAVPASRKPWVAIHGHPCDACVAPPSGVQVGRTADLVASAEPAADAQTIPLRWQHLMLAARREKTHQAAGQRFNIPMAIGAPENP